MITFLSFLTGTGIAFSILLISKSSEKRWLSKIPSYLKFPLFFLVTFIIYFFFYHYLEEQFADYFKNRENFEAIIKAFGGGAIVGIFGVFLEKLPSA